MSQSRIAFHILWVDEQRCIARLFERDARQQVLWFSGPPLAPGTVHVPTRPAHSIKYLGYLIKRKRSFAADEDTARKKGARYAVPRDPENRRPMRQIAENEDREPTSMWWALGMSADQVVANLEQLIESA